MEDPQHPGKFIGKGDPYPFTRLKYFSLPAKPGEDFITILHPRKPGESPLTATLVSDRRDKITIRTTLNGRTDLVRVGVDGAVYQRGDSQAVNIPMRISASLATVPSTKIP